MPKFEKCRNLGDPFLLLDRNLIGHSVKHRLKGMRRLPNSWAESGKIVASQSPHPGVPGLRGRPGAAGGGAPWLAGRWARAAAAVSTRRGEATAEPPQR